MPRLSAPAEDTDALLRDVVRLFVQAQRTTIACCSSASAKECEGVLILGQFGPLTVQDFAARMALEKTWASRLLTRLEKKRLVRRLDNPADGRSSLVELTAAGREQQARLREGLNDHSANLLRCVPAAHRPMVEQGLRHLRDALRQCVANCAADDRRRC